MYDTLGRNIGISDKKIGLSINPIGREYQLNRTKSPLSYRIVAVYKVLDMYKVEKMIHAILDSRRTEGEWFKDDEDTLTGEFVNFMIAFGAEPYNIDEEKSKKETSVDERLVYYANKFGKDTNLIRTYLGVDYEILLTTEGKLVFKKTGEIFDTPNKLYNNGIVKYVKGKKGISGTNTVSQFKVKATGERLNDEESQPGEETIGNEEVYS